MNEIKASMAGSMWQINVKLGDEVKAGEDVAILESMKMEIPIATERDGKVAAINVKEGDFINEGDVILVLE